MRTGLTVSVIGHAALLAWGIFSLPVPKPLDASQIEAIPVDFINLADVTSIEKGVNTAAVVEQPAPAVPVRKIVDEPPPPPPPPPPPEPVPPPEPTSPPLPEPPPPEPPPPEPPPPEPPPPEPEPAPSPEPPPSPPPEPSPPEPSPPEPPPPQPAPEAETPPPEASAVQPKVDKVPTPRLRPGRPEPASQVAKKKDENFDVDQITAMLDEQPPAESSERSDQPVGSGTPSGTVDSRMTASELDALRARLAECWSPPIGWTDPSEVRVVLMLFLNEDGSVSGAPQVLEAPGGRYAQAAPESAVRAVRRCAPYNLPAEKYDAWREVRVIFDPTDMGGA